MLRELCADLVELRRGDDSAERLRIEREQLELNRTREHEKTEEEFWAWARKNRDTICKNFIPPEERMATVRKAMFGERPADPASCDAPNRTSCGKNVS